MKEFFEMIRGEYKGFSRKEWIVYGIAFPVFVVFGCIVGGLFE